MIRRRIAREELFRLVFESVAKNETTEEVYNSYIKRNDEKKALLDDMKNDLEKRIHDLINEKAEASLLREKIKSELKDHDANDIIISNKQYELENIEKRAQKLNIELDVKLQRLEGIIKNLENQDELEELGKLEELYPLEDAMNNQIGELKNLINELIKNKVSYKLAENEKTLEEINNLYGKIDKSIKNLTINNTRLFLAPDQIEFIKKYMLGINNTKFNVMNIINNNMTGWSFERIGTVEQALLILAIYELVYEKENVPYEIAINEAIELAKIYGEEKTYEFINGVIANVMKSENI